MVLWTLAGRRIERCVGGYEVNSTIGTTGLMRKRGPSSRLRSGMAALVTVLALAACSKGPKEPEAPPATPHLRLMTTEQYLNTLGYIFGPSVTMEMKFA